MMRGIVIRVRGPRVVVRVGDHEHAATLRGNLKSGRRISTNPVTTGDRVTLSRGGGGSYVVEGVEPRTNHLARVDPGDPRRCHGISANVEQLLCMQAFRDPPLNLRALDRFLLLAHAARVPAVIVLNKRDLHSGPSPVEVDFYPTIGIDLLETSARTGEGVAPFRAALQRKTSVLVGPSGVGKSSLLNAAFPGLHLKTRPVSRATSKGVHTTTRVEWIDLPDGGVVLDTPGLRAVQPWGIDAENLADGFPEFEPYRGCRFADCQHRTEPDCAVRQAVEQGKIPAFRYDSYLRILNSLLGNQGVRRGRGGQSPNRQGASAPRPDGDPRRRRG